MICPNCKRDMIVVEYKQIELDYCTNCEGVWFDAGELELLLEKMKLKSQEMVTEDLLRLPEAESKHTHRNCPICRRAMKVTGIGSPVIEIDLCINGHGIFFDSGELHQLLSQLASEQTAGESAERQIVNFIGEVFKADEHV
jgi:Zn-finger nucleic acid-binding protein